ncbi:MAG: tRNA (adenosine(37)-N6)-threonylcarbamoyltransferase complex transferase subunit TsaD [Pseudomonadota bacterium]
MTSRPITVLGLESSCDETAAAVVTRAPDGAPRILSNVVFSQLDAHAAYGGVVPEIAARAHVTRMDAIVAEAMTAAGIGYSDLDAVAATAGPGLIGGVIVGLATGKALALAHGLPLVGVNHLEGHALSVRMTDNAPFPYLLLLVSGGHSQLLAVEGVGTYRRLGSTIDDAAGEAFDKTAKLLGLGHPGGPKVEAAATGGDAKRFAFPEPLKGRPGCDFSFSGLKTAVRVAAEGLDKPTLQDVADLAASFQAAAAGSLANRSARAMAQFAEDHPDAEGLRFVVAGGVAANCTVKAALKSACETHGFSMIVPPPKYCTDNGAMIAWAGAERLALGPVDDFAVSPRPRWPLDPSPRAGVGSGRKGPKA